MVWCSYQPNVILTHGSVDMCISALGNHGQTQSLITTLEGILYISTSNGYSYALPNCVIYPHGGNAVDTEYVPV